MTESYFTEGTIDTITATYDRSTISLTLTPSRRYSVQVSSDGTEAQRILGISKENDTTDHFQKCRLIPSSQKFYIKRNKCSCRRCPPLLSVDTLLSIKQGNMNIRIEFTIQAGSNNKGLEISAITIKNP